MSNHFKLDGLATISPAMLRRTWEEIEYRLDVCRAANGVHIETY
jgi:hypothetical protein